MGRTMIDFRMNTFLELCTVMNYHKTAENLNMTQPGVTQHIQYLEDVYNCKLFEYSNKKLTKTKQCIELENAARSIVALSKVVQKKIDAQQEKIAINIGATRTIGEYYMDDTIVRLLSNTDNEVNLFIDNTERLLAKLNNFELDVLLVEGYFDKNNYGYTRISEQELIGICNKDHIFAHKDVALEDIFSQHLIFRESGSGTRAVFESFLHTNGFSVDSFSKKSVISSNKVIEMAVCRDMGVSFVYDIIPNKNKNLATFRIKNSTIMHEFNYVYLKDVAISLSLYT